MRMNSRRFFWFFSIAFLCIFVAESQQDCPMHKVEIVCASFGSLMKILVCIGDRSASSTIPGSSVSSIVHTDRSDMTDHPQIEGFYIKRGSIKFIPTGIRNKFSNLKLLMIDETGLLRLNKENLKEFGTSLEILGLPFNKLISIDADLFEYNLNLKTMWLHDNPIRHIEPAFFANLKNLRNPQYIDLVSAGCMSQLFHSGSVHDIAKLEWMNQNCIDDSARNETHNLINDALCWEAQVLRIPEQIIEHTNEIDQASTARFEEMERKLNTRIDSLEKKLDNVLKIVTQIKCMSNDQIRRKIV